MPKLALHADGAQRSISMIGDISKLEIYLEISCLKLALHAGGACSIVVMLKLLYFVRD